MKQTIRTIFSLLLAAAMMSPCIVNAAADGAKDPAQDNSSAVATIYVGKELAVSQPDKFPTVTDCTFTMEAVKAWDNSNTDATENGKDIAVADMPMPTPVNTNHQKVSLTGVGEAEVQVGDFTGNANTNVADTSTAKYRSTPVNITFTKAGYYMYKVTEASSTPESIPGMAYDQNSYFVTVYVCNKTDDQGNTISGVYVHDITSYRNDTESAYEPDVTDIQNVTDNNNEAAVENNYENFSKVGKSEPEPGTDVKTGNPTGPNKLEAFRFYNDQTTHDVVVTNNVTGNLGDITKEFEYTVTLTGLEKGKTYTTNVDAQDKTDKKTTSANADIQSITGGKGTVNTAAKTFTADSDGNATFLIKLADDEVMVFNALPATSKYTVEEHSTDHIASFTSETTEPDTWVMTLEQKANNHSDTAISTNQETVDAVSNVAGRDQVSSEDNDGTVTINFRNHRDLLTPTGLPYYGNFAYAMLAAIAAIIAVIAVRRRREANADMEQ